MPLILKAGGDRIYIRGGQGQALTQLYGVKGWSYIKDRAGNANQFTFDFPEPCLVDGTRYIPTVRDEIFIYQSEADYTDDIRWFGGLITGYTDTTIQLKGSNYIAGYRIEAQSFDIILDKELRQPQKAGYTWENLLSFLLQTHFSTQLASDYSLIDNPASAPPVRINNGTLRTLLRAMRSLTDYDFFVDAYKRLTVYRAQDRPGTFKLEDQPESGMTVWDSRPVITRDARAIYNIVRQPFQSHVSLNDWDGQTFTGTGDPKGGGGQIALARTPATIEETIYLQEKFDGNSFDSSIWLESDDTATHHVDYPNQGYLFPANGQCQVVGGTGTLGGVALQSAEFFQYIEGAYIVQEFQLTNATGDGYICLFTDGAGVATGNFKGGLRVLDGALKALDGTTLLAAMGTTDNYLLWVTLTADGFQYDIQGGPYATKQRLRTETGITHATDYKIAPIINKNLQGSINSVRYRSSEKNVILEINGEKKVVGLEATDTDLPDIDAFLNLDEYPALLKFKAAEDIALIGGVTSATIFTAATGQGSKFRTGHRLLVGDNIVEEFNGKSGIVAGVAGDVVTLVSPGISGMSPGQQILIGTSVPAKGDKLVFRYGFIKEDEAVAADQASIDVYGPFPITLEQKDHIKRFDDAQLEAENFLKKYRDGILKIAFTSNSTLLPNEPDPMTAIPVLLNKRADPINRTLILQRVEITPKGGRDYAYNLTLESADPTTPLDDLVTNRNLIIGQDGTIKFSIVPTEKEVASVDDLVIRAASSLYITWANPEGRKYGEFKWKPPEGSSGGGLDFSDPNNSIFLPTV